MALPRETDTFESYTDQIVYFMARLASNPDTAPLVGAVEAVLGLIDEGQANLEAAQRAEVIARARRDHQDSLGDVRVRRFKRRVDLFNNSKISGRLFPLGVGYTVTPRGRPQIERLQTLATAIKQVGSSESLAGHAEADEIKQVLDEGLVMIGEVIATMTPTIEAWEAKVLDVAQANDGFKFRRAEGIAQLGVVIGQLRAKLGGDAKAAYAYTRPARTGSVSADDSVEVVEEAEG